MKTKILLALFCALCSLSNAQVNKEQRDVEGIESIEISKGANVSLIQCDKEAIEVVTEGCPTSDVETSVKSGILSVRMKKRTPGSAVQVFVYFKDMASISVKTGASVQTDCLFEHKGTLQLNVGAKCEAEMEITTDEIAIDATSAKVTLSGSAKKQSVSIGGAVGDSEYSAESLVSEDVVVDATNTDLKVRFTNTLSATVKAGTLTYIGNSDKVEANCSFGGKVVAEN